jgi:hypothetical protein
MAHHGVKAKAGVLAAMTLAALAGSAMGQAGTGDPDVIVGILPNVTNWGSSSTNPTDASIYAYSIGTTSCNISTVNITANDLNWISSTNQHPVIGQNLYRLRVVGGATRLEQIGMSWLKHGFLALTNSDCATCSGRGGSVLGVGCSDPYSSSLNGDQTRLGPRSHVNSSTGFYPYPFTSPGAGYIVPPSVGSGTAATTPRRLQVVRSDINPTLNANTLYFGEGQYVTVDDSSQRTTGRGKYQLSTNNNSYRRMTFNASFQGAMVDTTRQQSAGIYAWRDYGAVSATTGLFTLAPDNTVTIVPLDFNQTGDGRYLIGCKVTNLNNGRWRYEYAVQNIHSDRAGGMFRVPIPAGVTVSGSGFHGVSYHSGEPYSNTAWVQTEGSGFVTWTTPESYAVNVNSSALRWGTMYNFWFEATTAPVSGQVELGLFKPGTPGSGSVTLSVPGSPPCTLDYNRDTFANLDDLGDFITDYYTSPAIPGGVQANAPTYPGVVAGYSTPCPNAPDAPSPYAVDAYRVNGYRVGFVPNGINACPLSPDAAFPNLDNLGDYITAYYAGSC